MKLNKATSQAILNALCGKSSAGSIGSQNNAWLGVSTILPQSASGFTPGEPTAAMNYSRVEIHAAMNTTYQSVSQGDSSAVDHDSMIGNVDDINFPPAIVPSDPEAATGADWGTAEAPLVAWGLFTAKTGGSPYAWGPLTDENGDPDEVIVLTKNTLHFLKGRFELYLEDAGAVSASANA